MPLQREGKIRNNRIITHNGSKRNNQPRNKSLTSFTVEMSSVGDVIGTVSEHRIMREQFKIFQDKVKQYILHDLDNPRDIIIVVRFLKDPHAHVYTDKPVKLSKEEKKTLYLLPIYSRTQKTK